MTDSIRYTQADNSHVLIEPQGYSVPQPCNTWHQEIIDEWIAEGNTITPYDHLYGQDITDVKELKYAEIWTESDKRNVDSEKVFFTSGSKTQRNNDRLKKQNDRIANKKIKGQATTPEEDVFIDQWDDCMDWQDSTNDIADIAQDQVELLTDKYTVDAYDVETGPNWQAPFTL